MAIYNMDEVGVHLEPRPPKVVADKKPKKSLLSNLWEKGTNHSSWICKCYWTKHSAFPYIFW